MGAKYFPQRDVIPWPAEPLLLGRFGGPLPRSRWLAATPLVASSVLILGSTLLAWREESLANACTQLYRSGIRLSILEGCGSAQLTSPTILGDIWTAAAVLALAGTAILAKRQWRGYSELISHMSRNGALVVRSPGDRDALDAKVQDLNSQLRFVGRLAPLLLAIVIGGLVLYRRDIADYGSFGAAAGASEAMRAAELMWLSPENGLLRYLVCVAAAISGLYIVTVQNLVGPLVIRMLWRSRRHFSFEADTLNADGYHGWLPVRRILDATFAEIGVHGLALAAVSITLPAQGMHLLFWIAFAQWALTLPLYILFPVAFSTTFVRRFRDATISTLVAEEGVELKKARGKAAKLRVEQAYAERIAAVRSVPALPFRRIRETMVFFVSFFADVTAVVTVILVQGFGKSA